jgi:hypothetical protein
MCGENKDFFIIMFVALLLASVVGALRGQEIPQPGRTRQPLPDSGSSSNSSGAHWRTWEMLSEKFDRALNQHEATLNELYTRLQTSEANGKLLTGLCAELSMQNEDLRNYNEQIGQRMQERDEDLASAYEQIDVLEKRCLKAIIAIIALGAVIAVAAAAKVFRIFQARSF